MKVLQYLDAILEQYIPVSKHSQNTVKTLSQYYHNTVTVLGMKEKKKLLLWSQVDKELFTVTTHQPLILSLILEWEVGRIHEWAFQQIFYYLEKPCFVNISTKFRGDARKSQNAVVQLYSIIFLCTVSKWKPKQYKPKQYKGSQKWHQSKQKFLWSSAN